MNARLSHAWFAALASAWVSTQVIGFSLIPFNLMRDPPVGPILLLSLLYLAALATLAIVGSIILYRAWASIQGYNAPLTPGLALGLMFVPFFNLYWQFRAFHGFALAFNRTLDRTAILAPRIPPRLTLAYCILVCVSIPFQLIPILGQFIALATSIVGILVVWRVVNAVAAFQDATGDIDAMPDSAAVPA